MKKLFLGITLTVICLFGLFGCGKPDRELDNTARLENAAKYLELLYKDAPKETLDDYELTSVLMIEGVQYEVEWKVEVKEGLKEDIKTEVGDKKTKIVFNRKSPENIKYDLKGIVSDDKNEIEVVFKDKIHPAYKPPMARAEIMAAEKGATIKAEGVITAIEKQGNKRNIFFEDEDGGYYIFGFMPDETSEGNLLEGKKIEVAGKKDVYNGLLEFIDVSIAYLDDEIAKKEPRDITEKVKEATGLDAPELTDLMSTYVSIDGVCMKNVSDDGKHLYFEIEGKRIDFYLSGSKPILTEEEIEELKNKVKDGYEATVKGLVGLFSGKINLIPNSVDSIYLKPLPVLSDAEKAEKAKEKILSELSGQTFAGDLNLFTETVYDGVSVAWESGTPEIISNDGKILSHPVQDTEVDLTAVIKCGEEEITVTVTVKAAGIKKIPIATANARFEEGGNVWIEGKIIGLYNVKKGVVNGFFMADSTGAVYVRAPLPEGIALGDSVKVIGALKIWDNKGKEYTRQIDDTISIEKLENPVETMTPIKGKLEDVIGKKTEDGTVSEELKKEIAASVYYGGIYEFTGYVVTRKTGKFENSYLAANLEDDAPAMLYQYLNEYQEEFKAKIGTKVTVTAPMYGFAGEYGWRLGTYISLTDGEASDLPKAKNTVAEAKEAEKDTEVELIGTVIHVNGVQGFMLKDETAVIYVFCKTIKEELKPGYMVRVCGKTGFYKGPQIGEKELSVEILNFGDGSYTPDPEEMTVEQYLALSKDDKANFGKEVSVVGTVVADDKFVNLKLDDSHTANLYLSEEQKEGLKELAGKQVKITGITYNQNKEYPFTMFVFSWEEIAG